ncbi:MAG: DUF4124 domain-containing protein [Gammaproteobacteria bacterium]
MKHPLTFFSLGAVLLGLTQASAQQTLYRWVDTEGLVHYGDHVPPIYADQDREILNGHGVAVRLVEGTATEAELAERARLAALDEAAAEAEQARANHDRVLLDAYLSVEEIERLRDQRLNLLDAQVLVTEQYLTNLTQRLIELEQNASRFKPYSQEPDARDMPENLQLDITQTTASIELYEETLSGTRDRVTTLTETFARDIRRFQELTGLPVAEIN